VRLPPELLDQVVEHARREAPNECCGLIAVRDDVAYEVVEAENIEASPFRFNVDSKTLLDVYRIEDEGGRLGAIYHSHTRSEPYPSQTDIAFAKNWPGVEWLIVGLGGEEAEVRCFLIEDGRVEDVGVGAT
jgi:[CysO sulfur-carrier protein]-S-L-cysteine hydrolase